MLFYREGGDIVQALSTDKKYTYDEYEKLDDDNRYELLDGVIFLMTPPLRIHQEIGGELYRSLGNFLAGKPCKVYIAPFLVRLDNNTALEPDLAVVCDKSKLDAKGCFGAPDMVIEILSPSTASYDKVLKFNKYLEAGVREYWIVDPSDKIVSVHILRDGEYIVRSYGETDSIPVFILDGFEISMKEVYASLWE